MFRISDEVYKELHTWMKNYIDKKCIMRDLIMKGSEPNEVYNWIFYLRNGLFNHEFLSATAQIFIYHAEREIDKDLNFQIAGPETAATPMVAGIPLIARVYGLDINAFVVRKEKKKYGLFNDTEGLINDKPVVMIDDLCNSSEALGSCYTILNSKKDLTILPFAFTLVNKSNKEVHSQRRQTSDMFLPEYIKVISPFLLDDFDLYNPSH